MSHIGIFLIKLIRILLKILPSQQIRIKLLICSSKLPWIPVAANLVKLQSVRRSGNRTEPPKISLLLHILRARSLHLSQPRPWAETTAKTTCGDQVHYSTHWESFLQGCYIDLFKSDMGWCICIHLSLSNYWRHIDIFPTVRCRTMAQ